MEDPIENRQSIYRELQLKSYREGADGNFILVIRLHQSYATNNVYNFEWSWQYESSRELNVSALTASCYCAMKLVHQVKK
jgi:hypothetical protein